MKMFLAGVTLFGVSVAWLMLLSGVVWYTSFLTGFMGMIAVVLTCFGSERFLVWVQTH